MSEATFVDLTDLPVVKVRGSLADMAYAALRDAISSGTLGPGLRLREAALAKHFGVSPTPIREALRRLEREGLVEVSLNRGAAVAAVSRQEIVDLYEIREVLEERAVRRAAEAAQRDFARIEALQAEAETAVTEPDQVQFNRLDIEFHRALNDLGGNVQLAELAERIHRRIQGVRVRLSVHVPGRPIVSHAEHQAILSAVQTRDPDRAASLINAHIVGVRDVVVHVLWEAAGEGSG